MSSNQSGIARDLLIVLSVSIYMYAAESCLAAQFEWKTARPESQGFSAEKLNSLKKSLAAKSTKVLLIVRNDTIVCEWYAKDHGPTKKHYTASLAKALVGGTSLMVALNDGLVAVDDPVFKYIPQWKNHPDKSKITIRHLATHSSGIEDTEQGNVSHMNLPGWKGAFWRKDPDPFTLSRDKAPIIFTPGTKYAYSNPGMAILSYAVTASLRSTRHADIRTLLRERIMRPIGAKDGEWSVGYGKTYKVDGLDLVANWGGGSYTAQAVARVGRLMLRKGNWQGKQLIDQRWVEEVLQYARTPLPPRPSGNPQPACGLGWYTNFDGVWPKVPRDAFAGAGAGNQVLLVVPSLDLIVVRNGGNLYDSSKGEGFWGGIEKYMFNPVNDALTESLI
jgi:CubicO group peptidase (beta-lactamase class C family)